MIRWDVSHKRKVGSTFQHPMRIIISIDAEKLFDKNQHIHEREKPLSKLRIKGNFLYQRKSIMKNLQLASYLVGKEQMFCLRLGTRQGYPF